MPDTTAKTQAHLRETLLQLVLSGKWDEGQRLPSERQLALDFAVSRSSVREAIQYLIAQGLLVSRRGSGLYIQSRQAIDRSGQTLDTRIQPLLHQAQCRADMLEFRLMFECATARLAAQRADPAQRQHLRHIMLQMDRAVQTGDVDAEAAADAAFHELLSAAAHNLMIRQFHSSVINTLRLHITRNTYDASRRMTALAREQCQQRLRQHRAIGAAILEQSPARAEAAMRAHILFVGTQFVQQTPATTHGDMRVYRA